MAAMMALFGSLVLVLGLFDTLGGLRSAETRQAIDEVLGRSPGSGLGLDTAEVIELMRVGVYVAAVLGAAAVVFAVFVLQRHRAARVGLTVAAVLLLLTIPLTGLMPIFIAVAVGLVWSAPARAWYAGLPAPSGGAPSTGRLFSTGDQRSGAYDPAGQDPSSQDPSSQDPSRQDPTEQHPTERPNGQNQTGQPSADQPPAYGQGGQPAYGQPGSDQPPAYGQGAQPAYGQPGPQYGQQAQQYGQYAQQGGWPTPAYAPRDLDRRPVTVTVAAVLTWIGTGAVTAVCVILAVLLSTSSDAFVEEFDRAAGTTDVTFTTDEVLAVGWFITGLFLAWSLIAAVLAVFAFRRSNAARIALAVSAAMSALLSVVLILSVVSAVTLLLSGVAAVLLFTGGANEWYRRTPRGYGGYGGPGGQYGGYGGPGGQYGGQSGQYGAPGGQYGDSSGEHGKPGPW